MTAKVTKLEGRVSNLERNAEGGAGVTGRPVRRGDHQPRERATSCSGTTRPGSGSTRPTSSSPPSTRPPTCTPSRRRERTRTTGGRSRATARHGGVRATRRRTPTSTARRPALLKTDRRSAVAQRQQHRHRRVGLQRLVHHQARHRGDFAFSTKFARTWTTASSSTRAARSRSATAPTPRTRACSATASAPSRPTANCSWTTARTSTSAGRAPVPRSPRSAPANSTPPTPPVSARTRTTAIRILAGGRVEWGDGTVTDTSLFRSAAGVLATDGDLQVAGVARVEASSTTSGLRPASRRASAQPINWCTSRRTSRSPRPRVSGHVSLAVQLPECRRTPRSPSN